MHHRFGRILVACGVVAAVLAVTGPADVTAAGVPKLKKPGPPTSVAVVPANGAFVVSWSPPASDGGSPVTNYTVMAVLLKGLVKGSCSTTGNSCLVSGLTNSAPTATGFKPIKYTIEITATNSIGASKVAKLKGVTTSTTQNCTYVGPDGNLQGCDLSGSDLSNADLSGANLSTDDLSGFDLSHTNLSFAILNGTNVAGTDLGSAILTGVFSGHPGDVLGTPSALPSGWVLYNGYLIGPEVNLNNADLSGAPLANDQDLAGASLIDSRLSGLDLSQANLSGADLQIADLNGTDLANANLSNVQSGGVTGSPSALPVNWILTSGPPAVSEGYLVGPFADLRSADFSGINLSGLDLQGADMEISSLSGTNLSGADLQGANMSVSNATNANLSGADLQGADLTITDLRGADLSGANLANVVWSNTHCPDGTSSTQDGGTCLNNLIP